MNTNKGTSILKIKELPIILFTVIVFLVFSISSENFANFTNITVIIQQISINGIVALGVTMVIMIGGMDLSVGSLLALCGSVAAMMDNAGVPIFINVFLTLIFGTLCGFLNGYLITKLNIPDIIVTLANMNIFRGVAVIITKSQWLTDFTPDFLALGSSSGGLLALQVLIYVFIAAFMAFTLKYTPQGRLLYAYGGNREAAAIMGLNTNKIKISVYSINGFLMAIAGILFASTFASIQAATAATTVQFQTMGAALIGGANIFGGAGSVVGTVFGSFLMGILRNGLVQIRASEYWLDFITGAIILLALCANLIKFKKSKRKGGTK